jgi:hypothetical protein
MQNGLEMVNIQEPQGPCLDVNTVPPSALERTRLTRQLMGLDVYRPNPLARQS